MKDLFQIATHEQNAEFARHRLEIANRYADLRERKQALKLYEIELRAERGRPRPQQHKTCPPAHDSINDPTSAELAQNKI